MNNTYENTNKKSHTQVAGVLPGDYNIEFIGVRETKEVLWLQNGRTNYFNALPVTFFNLLKTAYLKTPNAVAYLSKQTNNLNRQVELFTYYMYGDLDGTPDIKNGKLAPAENFRHIENCPSLQWKNLVIGNHKLTNRQLIILDLMGKDMPDKQIAARIGIAHKTLNNHKQTLFKALGIHSKFSLLKKAFQEKILS